MMERLSLQPIADQKGSATIEISAGTHYDTSEAAEWSCRVSKGGSTSKISGQERLFTLTRSFLASDEKYLLELQNMERLSSIRDDNLHRPLKDLETEYKYCGKLAKQTRKSLRNWGMVKKRFSALQKLGRINGHMQNITQDTLHADVQARIKVFRDRKKMVERSRNTIEKKICECKRLEAVGERNE